LTNKKSVFDQENANKMYILSVIVENKPGVLFRITNLFRSRNFNIESITVGITEKPDLSRMTITTVSDVKTLEQLVKQLQKLIDVIQINVLNKENAVYRELALVKMNAKDPTTRIEIANFASIYRGNIMDISNETITVEIIGTPDKIDAFKNLVSGYGIIQVARTGVSALPRGAVDDDL